MAYSTRRAGRRSRRSVFQSLLFALAVLSLLICIGLLLRVSASAVYTIFNTTLPYSLTTLGSVRIGEESTPGYSKFLNDARDEGPPIARNKEPLVSRIGFGSCTSRVAIEQPIWQRGVIPSDPQAWIWAGDIAYMDWPDTMCKLYPEHYQCNCTRDWLHNNRQTCLSGNITHASMKLQLQLQNPDYKHFLDFMCSNLRTSSISKEDLSLCSRPVYGTWDDHDFNWQDGDHRLPNKEQQKHLFLDAFGVPVDSPRRMKNRGIYWKHTLNKGIGGKEIDVLLLDERFHRDTKPCKTRANFCKKVALPDPKRYKNIWCKDFLQGGPDGRGSCCRKDEQVWKGWCKINKNPGDNLWEAACNPKSKTYGSEDLALDSNTGIPILKSALNMATSHNFTDDDGILCEMLGPTQRAWLQRELYNSRAPLKLLVSGSPVFNNPMDFVCRKAAKRRTAVNCSCYDDYDCYHPAQLNLIHTMAHAPGCVVVLTGDFHYSDIKALQSGRQMYSDAYDTFSLPHPIFQIMASGLTDDTAQQAPCDEFRADKIGLRVHGECDFVSGPAFGMIEVNWDQQVAKLQVRDGDGRVKVESEVRLDNCQQLK